MLYKLAARAVDNLSQVLSVYQQLEDQSDTMSHVTLDRSSSYAVGQSLDWDRNVLHGARRNFSKSSAVNQDT